MKKYYKALASLLLLAGFASAVQAEIKPYPAGLIMRGKYDGNQCEAPRGNMAAGYCQVFWRDIEPVKGEFHWDVIDDAITTAEEFNAARGLSNKDGYKVMIRIRTGIYAPDWVKNDPEIGKITWYFKDTSANQTFDLPLFWVKAYQDHYADLMTAAANRYDDNNVVGGVAASMCMTVHTEIMWNRTGRDEVRATNMAAMRALGTDKRYTNERDMACLKRQVRIHANKWQNTPTLFGSHLYQVYDYSNGSKSSDTTKTRELFDYCRSDSWLGKRCILGNNSLRHDEVNNDGSINQLLYEVAQAGDPVYFQTNVFKSDSANYFGLNELKGAMQNAIDWGAIAVEIPMEWDCSNYFNKTGCTDAVIAQRQEEFHPYQAQLKNKFRPADATYTNRYVYTRHELSGAGWVHNSGALDQLSSTSSGEAWGIANGGIWFRPSQHANWQSISGALTHIQVAGKGRVVGVNSSGNLYQRNRDNGSWTSLTRPTLNAGEKLTTVDTTDDGQLWATTSSNRVFRRTASGAWSLAPGGLKQVSVNDDGTEVWGIASDDTIWRWNGSSWSQIGGSLKQISAGTAGNVWGVNSNNTVYRRKGNSWQSVGQMSTVSAR
ncbi:tectonin domain-containing protein [Shewanella sp. GXUN23E]|uniref:tectonin domain-containing protein n=1 Tax=Shewanella sp. GXUN23E TaxID=3422498 RepID=UPI003D7D34B2